MGFGGLAPECDSKWLWDEAKERPRRDPKLRKINLNFVALILNNLGSPGLPSGTISADHGTHLAPFWRQLAGFRGHGAIWVPQDFPFGVHSFASSDFVVPRRGYIFDSGPKKGRWSSQGYPQ